MLYTAAFLIFATGLAHSVLGERYLLARLFQRENLPKLFGGTSLTIGTLRFAHWIRCPHGLLNHETGNEKQLCLRRKARTVANLCVDLRRAHWGARQQAFRLSLVGVARDERRDCRRGHLHGMPRAQQVRQAVSAFHHSISQMGHSSADAVGGDSWALANVIRC